MEDPFYFFFFLGGGGVCACASLLANNAFAPHLQSSGAPRPSAERPPALVARATSSTFPDDSRTASVKVRSKKQRHALISFFLFLQAPRLRSSPRPSPPTKHMVLD